MRGLLRTLDIAPLRQPESEEQSILRAQHGDRAAFDALVREHECALRRFVSKRVGSEHVDDVVQDTWLAAWSSLGRYTVRAKFRTWLYAIAANKCRDVHRKATTVELDPEVADGCSEYGRLDLRCAVGEALNQLSEVHREVLDMYYFEELNLPEIARVTGRNLNTVKYQFYRAHKEFAAIMGGEDA